MLPFMWTRDSEWPQGTLESLFHGGTGGVRGAVPAVRGAIDQAGVTCEVIGVPVPAGNSHAMIPRSGSMTDAPSASLPPLTAAARIERSYTDAEGSRWRVYEQPFAEFDRRSGMSLIFASDSAVRRVRNYPAEWTEMPVDELVRLSWQA